MLSAEEVLRQENLKQKKVIRNLRDELEELRSTKFADSKNLESKIDKLYAEMKTLSAYSTKNNRSIEREFVKMSILESLMGACLIGNCILLLVIIFFK